MEKKSRFLETIILIAVMILTVVRPGPVLADDQTEEAAGSSASAPEAGPLEDNLVTTKHTAVINGKELSYTAETGTMIVNTADQTCEIFYTAYTLDDTEDLSDRPITFAFNGGPGCCSMYLHIGCLGPRRLELDKDGTAVKMPTRLVDNDNSLLDMTDLVFIDAVGTGYSRPAGNSELEAFIGYDNDNRTIGDFIRQYVSRNDRWESKKYLAGESYGTIRAVGVCNYLADTYSMYLNGLMLISCANDLSTLSPNSGNELPYTMFLPTYAADAWYHKKVSEEYQKMDLEDFLDVVREFVEKEYVPALFAGNQLTKSEKNSIAEKIASYTGLSVDYVLDKNLRISLDEFSEELLHDQKLVIGSYDGRISGPVIGSGDTRVDPSDVSAELAYGSAVNDYFANELGFRTDRTYLPIDYDIMPAWKYPGDASSGFFCQEETIYKCMSANSFLKVWVLCGYYDGATPFYSAEWIYRHIFLNDEQKDNLSFTYYPCGHMIYMEKDSLIQFRKDASAWYSEN